MDKPVDPPELKHDSYELSEICSAVHHLGGQTQGGQLFRYMNIQSHNNLEISLLKGRQHLFLGLLNRRK
jgi:hypothetical protein